MRIVLGIAGALLLLGGVVALVVIYSGAYNVAATTDHGGPVRWVLSTMRERSVATRADEVPDPIPVDAEGVAHGFEHYQAMCVECHGAPGVERGELGRGMNPEPPDLAKEASELSDDELFWITKHGIKMAGMPAFGPTHSDEEIWGIVAFTRELARLSADDYRRWQATAVHDAEGGHAIAEPSSSGMGGMDHGAMANGMDHGAVASRRSTGATAPPSSTAHADHPQAGSRPRPSQPQAAMPAAGHAGHPAPPAPTDPGALEERGTATEPLLALVRALVQDPVVRREIEKDTALREAWSDPDVRRAIGRWP